MGPQPPRAGAGGVQKAGGDGLRVAGGVAKGGKGGKGDSKGAYQGIQFMKSYGQGLILIHFSAQFEPCLSHKNTLHTLNTP